MKITKEYLLNLGFELMGEAEQDPFFRMQFVYNINSICPKSLNGSLHGIGFELYGYGSVEDKTKMNEILKAIETLAAKPLSQIIKK